MEPDPRPTPGKIAADVRQRAEAFREKRGIKEPSEGEAPQPPGPAGPVERKLTDLTVDRPGVGLGILILGPLLPLIFIFDRVILRDDQPHESWTFRYHDWTARNPEAGLCALFLGAILTLALVVVGLLVFGKLVAA